MTTTHLGVGFRVLGFKGSGFSVRLGVWGMVGAQVLELQGFRVSRSQFLLDAAPCMGSRKG